jgi:hypothetical protein
MPAFAKTLLPLGVLVSAAVASLEQPVCNGNFSLPFGKTNIHITRPEGPREFNIYVPESIKNYTQPGMGINSCSSGCAV